VTNAARRVAQKEPLPVSRTGNFLDHKLAPQAFFRAIFANAREKVSVGFKHEALD